MEFRTKIEIEPLKRKITADERIIIVGSCFANEIGNLLKQHGFSIEVNPFGTLYNTYSVTSSIERLAQCNLIAEEQIIDISKHSTECKDNVTDSGVEKESSSRYCSFFHHSSLAKGGREEFLNFANSLIKEGNKAMEEADTIIVTLGTSWAYRHLPTDVIVSNCHKINPKEFERFFIGADESYRLLKDTVESNPSKRFIFTVSPIRHMKDGAHGNQISKASLLLAINRLVGEFPERCHYFPAYEIVLDELRDYRFYASDMVHPSEVAVKYIFERFKENCIDRSAYRLMEESFKLYRQGLHRTLYNE